MFSSLLTTAMTSQISSDSKRLACTVASASRSKRRSDAIKIFMDAVDGSRPNEDRIRSQVGSYASASYLSGFDRIVFAGAGKASIELTRCLMKVFTGSNAKGDGARMDTTGLIITKYHHTPKYAVEEFAKWNVSIAEAAHPIPDSNGEKATRQMIAMLKGNASERTLVIFACTGGGSALTSAPVDGITLDDVKETTRILLASGAEITDVNTIRKHLTTAHGGKCAAAAYPSTVLTFVISDVLGNNLEIIGGGPTTQSTATIEDVRKIVSERGIIESLPGRVRQLLQDPERMIPPKLKFDQERLKTFIVASNRQALERAKQSAIELGYKRCMVLTSTMCGEAKELAKMIASISASESVDDGAGGDLCIVMGGESTVDLGKDTRPGLGGRNQEMALAIAFELRKMKIEKSSPAELIDNLTVLCAGTDGTDGPTEVAGAVVDSGVVTEANHAAAHLHLKSHDAFTFFDSHCKDCFVSTASGDSGPGTGTNVCDVVVCLRSRST